MIAVTPSFVLKDKDIVQFQCDHCVCTVYKLQEGATVEFKDNMSDTAYVSWYPLDMEMFRVKSENDIYYHDDKYIGWQRGGADGMNSIAALKSLLDAILVFLLLIRQRSLKTNQERFEFIVDVLVTIAVISL